LTYLLFAIIHYPIYLVFTDNRRIQLMLMDPNMITTIYSLCL